MENLTRETPKTINSSSIVKASYDVAQFFKCQQCNLIPLKPFVCKNIDCEKILCEECMVTQNRACPACQFYFREELPTLLSKIFKSILVKCPKACSNSIEMKNLKSHLKVCEPQASATSTKSQEQYEILLRKLKNKQEITVSELKNDKLLINMNKETLNLFMRPDLQNILGYRSKPTSGSNKEVLVDRILEHFTLLKVRNENLKKLISGGEIKNLTNEELGDELGMRAIAVGGNKEEKIKKLEKYLEDLNN